jgi:hypothetical protein
VKQPGRGGTASAGGPGGTRPNPDPLQGARLIEIRAVDRETARKNMSSGLVAGGFAAAVFALCFVAAFLYIAQ